MHIASCCSPRAVNQRAGGGAPPPPGGPPPPPPPRGRLSNSAFDTEPFLSASQRPKICAGSGAPFGPAGRPLAHSVTSASDSEPFLSLSIASKVGGPPPPPPPPCAMTTPDASANTGARTNGCSFIVVSPRERRV